MNQSITHTDCYRVYMDSRYEANQLLDKLQTIDECYTLDRYDVIDIDASECSNLDALTVRTLLMPYNFDEIEV